MKIAFIGGKNIHKLGGIESYMMNLCTELVKLGYEPLVYCESEFDGEEDINGFHVIHQKAPKSKFLSKPWCGLKAMIKTRFKHPDIKIYHFNAAGPAYFGFVARLLNRKTIYQGHGLEWKRTKYGEGSRKLINIIENVVVRWFTKYGTAVSDEQSDYWNARGQKMVTIPTAVFLPKENIDQSIMSKYGLKPGEYYLSLGRLTVEKNPHIIIKSFIESGIRDKKLVIAGSNDADPTYVESLHKLAEGHENIIFTGAVYGDEKEALMQNCFCFCIPSTLEGLAITLLEAMSYGKIVIASDIPSNIEGLADNGIWVKAEDVGSLSDAMGNVHDNYAKLAHLGESNYKRICEKFTWEIVAKQYDNFIKNIVINN